MYWSSLAFSRVVNASLDSRDQGVSRFDEARKENLEQGREDHERWETREWWEEIVGDRGRKYRVGSAMGSTRKT